MRANGVFYDAFEFVLSEPAVERIEIVCFNDVADPVSRENLNLYIDKIVPDGRAFESEIDGLFTRVSGFIERNVPREDMKWNGVPSFGLVQLV